MGFEISRPLRQLNNPRQFLQRAPVVKAFLFGANQGFARVPILVEVLREAAYSAREADEVIDFVRLRFDEEIRFLGRIALEAEALGDLVLGCRAWLLNFNVATRPGCLGA